MCLSTSNVCFLALVWKWEAAAAVGQVGERAWGAGEAEKAATSGGAGPGACHCSQQSWHAQRLNRHAPPQLLVLFLLPYSPPFTGSWLQHQHWPNLTSSPCYQFVLMTSGSPAMTGLMSDDSIFSNQLGLVAPKLHRNYNQGQYGVTLCKPGFILQEHNS